MKIKQTPKIKLKYQYDIYIVPIVIGVFLYSSFKVIQLLNGVL